MSFSCNLFDCADGVCATKCTNFCGGEISDVSKYACTPSEVICECAVSANVALWVGIAIGLLFVCGCATGYKCWIRCGTREERKGIVRA